MPRLALLRRGGRALGALTAVGLIAALGFGARARADGPPPNPTLHEQIPEDPREDVGYSATTLEGDLPAAIQTPSGLTTAPDPRRSPAADHVYGGTTTDDSPDSTYEPDRDTRRPKIENYDDPFSPATAPFKRLRAYDWVDADYSLRVRDRSLQKLPVGGSLSAGDEPFYGDLSVDLLPGQPVRIPTVGPGARILRMHANPEVTVEVLRDGADNWFARGTTPSRVRLVVELAIPRDTFGREFADVDWPVLEAITMGNPVGVPQTPPGSIGTPGYTGVRPPAKLHEAAFNEVARAIGISRAMRPREVVHRMVEYFRAFEPSTDPPTGRGDIYLDLALSKKGVCRHRAFAFLVTALGIGVPARMVVNEAHAWVEVYDSKLWHRVDLGGAAANLQNDSDPNKPPYVPPPDPYAWPTSRDSGQDLAERNRAEQEERQEGRAGDAHADGGAPPSAASGKPTALAPPAASATAAEPSSDSKLPESDVALGAIDGDVHRGLPLHLQGTVASAGAGCGHLRVDVLLAPHSAASAGAPHTPPAAGRRGKRTEPGDAEPSASAGIAVGSLSTDDRGRFDGAVVIPRDLTVGDYDVVVQTPGDARCGAGRSR